MNSKPEGAGARACWFVGATYDGNDDQTPRFLQEGIWENGYQDKYLDAVKSVQVGDRIAIKSSYTRKHNLPFDNRGQTVSVMAVKVIGTVKENLGDGRTLKVDWKSFDPPREWYFYTNRSTVWRVLPYVRPQAVELLQRLREPRRFLQIITGARQVGKTTLIAQVAEQSELDHRFASPDEPTLRGPEWIAQ